MSLAKIKKYSLPYRKVTGTQPYSSGKEELLPGYMKDHVYQYTTWRTCDINLCVGRRCKYVKVQQVLGHTDSWHQQV